MVQIKKGRVMRVDVTEYNRLVKKRELAKQAMNEARKLSMRELMVMFNIRYKEAQLELRKLFRDSSK